jgi:hypothetical protein
MLARVAKDKEHAVSQMLPTAISVIGIDIGKNSFNVVGHDQRGAIAERIARGDAAIQSRPAFPRMSDLLTARKMTLVRSVDEARR